jgi:hypothetical protein
MANSPTQEYELVAGGTRWLYRKLNIIIIVELKICDDSPF